MSEVRKERMVDLTDWCHWPRWAAVGTEVSRKPSVNVQHLAKAKVLFEMYQLHFIKKKKKKTAATCGAEPTPTKSAAIFCHHSKIIWFNFKFLNLELYDYFIYSSTGPKSPQHWNSQKKKKVCWHFCQLANMLLVSSTNLCWTLAFMSVFHSEMC